MKLKAIAVSAAALGALLLAAQPAHAATVTLSTGHVDVIDVNLSGGRLSLMVEDATGATPAERDPADVVLNVKSEARTTVPSGSQWSFLGPAGSPVWILPRVQNANLLWAGWNTEDVASGTVGLSLTSVTGPGNLAVYRPNTLSAPTVFFNSGDGLPDNLTLSAGTHAHETWAFTAAGTYTATFTVTAAGAVSDTATLTFTVQP